MLARVSALLFLAMAVLSCHAALAQQNQPPPAAAALTPEAVREMANKMSDAEFRQLVLDRMGPVGATAAPTEAAPAPARMNPIEATLDLLGGFGMRIINAVTDGPRMAEQTARALDNFLVKVGALP